MALKKLHWIGIISGAAAIIADFVLFMGEKDRNMFYFLIGIAAVLIFMPFVIGLAAESKREQEVSEIFLEFSRNLAESVSTGTPISKSIMNVSAKNYGALTPYVKKLANQIALGIPVNQAFLTFAYEVDNPVISRAVGLISQAERAGGEIDYILDSVAKSIDEIDKLKKERKAAISTLVVQGYLIFLIFIGIMLVMEFKILPLTSSMGSFGGISGAGGDVTSIGTASAPSNYMDPQTLARPFLFLLLTQGFFTGLTIGKLSEGSLKAGIRHSFIMTVMALLISTGAKAFIGG